MAASKCAIALLVLAIEPPRRWMVISLRVIVVISVFWGVAAVFATAFQCAPTRYALGPTTVETCIDQSGMQFGIRAFDIATDVPLRLLPAVMMMYVQTNFWRKLMVSSLFGIRLA